VTTCADDISVTCTRRRLRGWRRLLEREAGVTLPELLVTMTVLGVMVTTLTGVFVSGSNAEIDLNKRFQAQTEARVALQSFRRDVHRACDATFSGSSSVTLKTLPTTATSYSCNVVVSTWCVTGSAWPYTLRRAAGSASCTTSSVRRAGNLTSAAVFADVPGAAGSGLLRRTAIDLSVDTKLTDVQPAYRLTDSIALCNAARS